MIVCPCCSGKKYKECCEPVIKDRSALTALELMRSRYTAYCNEDAEYLYETSHSKTKGEISLNEIKEWAKENTWIKLEILETKDGGANDSGGLVEFKAYFKNRNGRNEVHHERSSFLKEEGKWFYLEGIANPDKPALNYKVSRNEPCPCRSGKKFKKCCGK